MRPRTQKQPQVKYFKTLIYLSQLSHLFLTDQMKGFVSIFQLLGRYVRRMSVVLHRNFARRGNQHVRFSLHKKPVHLQILRNFVVHKPHTRKTCLTEPLRRIILSPIVG